MAPDETRRLGGGLLRARPLIWGLGPQRERRCALFRDDKRCAESWGIKLGVAAKRQVTLSTGEKRSSLRACSHR